VFKLNTDGTGYTVLKTFTGSDGAYPKEDLLLSGETLYGTTSQGGTAGRGTVFKVTTNGTAFSVLKHFTTSDGASVNGGLALSGATLYGTTAAGGTPSLGTVFKVNTNGAGFAILRWFNAGATGANPGAGPILSGSVLYGTTYNGGSFGKGVLFRMNTNGTGYTVLKSFNGTDGAAPFAPLTLSGGQIYGTTRDGGWYGLGTVFRIDLAPQFSHINRSAEGHIELNLMGEPGRTCEILVTTNLANWESLATLTNQNGTINFTDVEASHLRRL
jgi:uncharacterized repeat protein (TIGR03803 family)